MISFYLLLKIHFWQKVMAFWTFCLHYHFRFFLRSEIGLFSFLVCRWWKLMYQPPSCFPLGTEKWKGKMPGLKEIKRKNSTVSFFFLLNFLFSLNFMFSLPERWNHSNNILWEFLNYQSGTAVDRDNALQILWRLHLREQWITQSACRVSVSGSLYNPLKRSSCTK